MARLKLVPPPDKPAVHIDALLRDEIRQKGRAHWGAVHVACDRSEPVLLTMLRRIHRL